jgi:adenylate cyclase
MKEPLKLQVYERDRLAFEASLLSVFELGRQRAGEPDPYALLAATATAPARLILALQQEKDNVSRQHLLLEPLSSGAVRVHNGSQIPLPYGPSPAGKVAPSGSIELTPPFQLSLPPRSIAISRSDSVDEHGVQGLDEQTIGPGRLSELSRRLRPLPELSPPQLDALLGWLQTTMGVLQSTVAAADFLDKAVEALVQIVGLHSGRVLRLDDDTWKVAAVHEPSPLPGQEWRPSTHVLERVRREKRTFWQYPEAARSVDTPSLGPLQTVVAAPVLDGDGQVIGALYGERRRDGAGAGARIGKLEAMLVELLACGVATGLARQQHEEAALRAQVRFEQFFTPDLARQLAQDP